MFLSIFWLFHPLLNPKKTNKKRRSANMIDAVISNGEHHFGGGLWSDLVSIHKDCRLPLFWSIHKNSITDKYFHTFNKIRLEEDHQYAKVAELKREMTCACISNCGSFLFSGYSDGWLIKNYIETGQFVKKFKYSDFVKKFNESQKISNIFVDSVNSFVILAKSDKLLKIDFFSGETLATLKISEFDPSLNFSLENCLIKCDQTNNLVVMISPTNQVLIINWNNMTVVRYFSLKNQSAISCFTIAKYAKKILVATQDQKLGIYDIFSSQLISCFKMDGVLQTLDIREDCWLIAGAFSNQKSVHLWKIDNLDWKVEKEIDLPFESKLRDLGGDLRKCYFDDPETENQKIEYKSKQFFFLIFKPLRRKCWKKLRPN